MTMAVTVKSSREIHLMREAGKRLAETHMMLKETVRPGISTWEIDRIGREFIEKMGCIPSFLNYNGYPNSICISLNDEVVHGIPSKDRIVEEGDIISLDAGLIYEGYHSDAARTYGVGRVSPEARKLMDVTKQSFFEGIRYAREGCHLFDISNAIASYAESFGYGVVRALVGHGIGSHLHEDPEVPNHRQRRRGILLKAGMTLAIEPMINIGRCDVAWLDDDWTVVTEDGSLSAHYENTVLITKGEPELLTIEPAGV